MLKKSLYFRILVFYFVSLYVWVACKPQTEKENTSQTSTSVHIRYARLLQVKEYQDYVLVNIFSKNDTLQPALQYALVKDLATQPQETNCIKIKVPIRHVACLGTPHAAMFTALGATTYVKGIAGSQYTTNDSLLAQVAAGMTTEIGTANGEVNMESLIKLSPDVVTLYQMPLIDKLKTVGLSPLLVKEYEESTPLARAEWIKLIGLLIDQPEAANQLFDEVARNYTALQSKTQQVTVKPSVFANIPYGNVWYMPAKSSFPAHYWKDAGANFIWANHEGTGTLPLSIEQVMDKAQNADFWLNVGSYTSLQELLAQDKRFQGFGAVQKQQVFNTVLKVSAQGGNAYNEIGMIRPDWVLQDLIKIFHPQLLPNHQFIFYKKL